MSSFPANCLFQLPCPQCGHLIQAPLSEESKTAACPQCAIVILTPGIIGWTPPEPVTVDLTGESQRRKMKVRTPAMPGSRIGLVGTGSKEPPRLPKPGDIAPPIQSPSLAPAPAPAPAPVISSPPPSVGSPVFPSSSLPTPSAPRSTTLPAPLSLPDPIPSPAPTEHAAPRAIHRPPIRQKRSIKYIIRHLLPLAGAAFVCSAALAAWLVWPAAPPHSTTHGSAPASAQPDQTPTPDPDPSPPARPKLKSTKNPI